MSWVSLDIEADGPIPGDYSMISIGAVIVEPGLERSFYAELRPISSAYVEQALAVTGFSREETLGFAPPEGVMKSFRGWLKAHADGPPRFISDNCGFDWSFVNWYFHHFLGENPFGHNSTHLGSLYRGLTRDMGARFDHLRETEHTHNALDDARGNAEVMLAIQREYGVRLGPQATETTADPGG